MKKTVVLKLFVKLLAGYGPAKLSGNIFLLVWME